MNRPRVDELAAAFWERAGGAPPFPRDLEAALVLCFPVHVVEVAGLSCRGVTAWLGRRGIELPLAVEERPLDGCLVAYRGRAFAFLEATLGRDDRRVILAHEVAHFLADYAGPRSAAVGRLGTAALEVIDGQRQPDWGEQVVSALTGPPLAGHVHYLSRGAGQSRAVLQAVERRANALACELLAPKGEVRRVATEQGLLPDQGAWAALLMGTFGFPPAWAASYAKKLLSECGRRLRFSDILGLATTEADDE